MECHAPRGKELFVVRPNVRSRIRRESASLSRFSLTVDDNPMAWLIQVGLDKGRCAANKQEMLRCTVYRVQKWLSRLTMEVEEISWLHKLKGVYVGMLQTLRGLCSVRFVRTKQDRLDMGDAETCQMFLRINQS